MTQPAKEQCSEAAEAGGEAAAERQYVDDLLRNRDVAYRAADLRGIWEGKPQTYRTYDGRSVTYDLSMIEAVLADDFTYAETNEKVVFLAYCINERLDPIRKQVFFIKYKKGERPAFVTSWQVYLDRAQRHRAFDGFENGVVWRVTEGDSIKTIRGRPCDYEPDAAHVVAGGWATVYRKDISHPFDVEVPLSEMIGERYDRDTGRKVPTRTWARMPTTMATKTPTARALRQAFPEHLGGLLAEGESLIEEFAPPSPVAAQAADAPRVPTRQERQEAVTEPPAPPTPVAAPGPAPAKPAQTPAQRVAALVRGQYPDVPAGRMADAVCDLASRVSGGKVQPTMFRDREAWTDELADRCAVMLAEWREASAPAPPEWLGRPASDPAPQVDPEPAGDQPSPGMA